MSWGRAAVAARRPWRLRPRRPPSDRRTIRTWRQPTRSNASICSRQRCSAGSRTARRSPGQPPAGQPGGDRRDAGPTRSICWPPQTRCGQAALPRLGDLMDYCSKSASRSDGTCRPPRRGPRRLAALGRAVRRAAGHQSPAGLPGGRPQLDRVYLPQDWLEAAAAVSPRQCSKASVGCASSSTIASTASTAAAPGAPAAFAMRDRASAMKRRPFWRWRAPGSEAATGRPDRPAREAGEAAMAATACGGVFRRIGATGSRVPIWNDYCSVLPF